MSSIANIICHLCLQNEEPVMNIFSNELKEKRIPAKIEKYLFLNINEDDNNAKCICSDCLNILEEFDLYCKQVEQNQQKLLEIELESVEGSIYVSSDEISNEHGESLYDFDCDSDLDIKTEEPEYLIEYDGDHDEESKENEPQSINSKAENILSVEGDVEVDGTASSATANIKREPRVAVKFKTEDEFSELYESLQEQVDNVSGEEFSELYESLEEQVDSGNVEEFSELYESQQDQIDSVTSESDYGLSLQPKQNENYVDFPKNIIENGAFAIRGNKLTQLLSRFYELKCYLCPESSPPFSKIKILFKHYREKHLVNGYVMCCGKKFEKRSPMATHMVNHVQPDALKCPECGRKGTSLRAYKEHMANHLGGLVHKWIHCNICGIRCNSPHYLQIHKNKMHAKSEEADDGNYAVLERERAALEPHEDYPYLPKRIYDKNGKKIFRDQKLMDLIKKFYKFTCEKCPEDKVEYSDLSSLFAHYEEDHSVRGYLMCCGKQLRTYQYLIYHMASHLQPELFKCSICSRMHTKPQALREHMNSHKPRENRVYFCTKCPRKYGSQSGLRKHLISHVPKEQRKKYSCKECGKIFFDLGACQTHFKSTHVDEKLVCDQCGKECKNNVALSIHLATHSKPRKTNRECEYCKKRFVNKPNYFKHMDEVHSKIHNCEQCPYVGNKWLLFERHMKECHTAKPHLCKTCGRSFKYLSSLQTHLQAHAGELKFFCELCNMKYLSLSGLRRHQLREHLHEYKDILAARREKRRLKWKKYTPKEGDNNSIHD